MGAVEHRSSVHCDVIADILKRRVRVTEDGSADATVGLTLNLSSNRDRHCGGTRALGYE